MGAIKQPHGVSLSQRRYIQRDVGAGWMLSHCDSHSYRGSFFYVCSVSWFKYFKIHNDSEKKNTPHVIIKDTGFEDICEDCIAHESATQNTHMLSLPIALETSMCK